MSLRPFGRPTPQVRIWTTSTLRKLTQSHIQYRSGRKLRSRSACIGPTQEKTGDGFTHRGADPALMQRLGQGTRERDGQERAGRLNASLMGTWSAQHRSGMQMEKAAAPVTLPNYGQNEFKRGAA